MADTNSLTIVGRLTRESEFKVLSTGTALATFSLANNRGYGNYAKTFFFDCKYFGKGAEAINQYLTKGKQVAITGEVTIETWTDNGTGVKHSKTIIVCKEVQLLASSSKDGVGAQNPTEDYGEHFGEGDSVF